MANDSIQVTSKALQTLAQAIADRRQANQQLSVKLEGEVLRNFESEGHEFNTPWAPLALSTIRARLRKGSGSKGRRQKAIAGFKAGKTSKQVFQASGAGLLKILQDTGALRQSFAGFYDSDQAGVGSQSNAAHADLSLVHQEGSPSRHIPARNMLPPADMALDWALVVYQNHIDQARAVAGL
jgi:phage gpG-like protein